MPIKPRGDSWQVTVCIQGVRRSGSAANEVLAKSLEQELEAQVRKELGVIEVWTLGHAIEQTTKRFWRGAKAERSSTLNADLVKRRFGSTLKLDELDVGLIGEWVDELEAMGNSPATVNRKLACLSKILKTAQAMGGLQSKPDLAVYRKKEGRGRIRWVTLEEEAALLALLKQWGKDEHRDTVVCLVDTGMRCGEVFRLTGQDCDLGAGQIRVWETKADLPRSVPMTTRVKEILERRVQTSGSKPLFPGGHWSLTHTWSRAKTALGLDGDSQWVPHVLRHTCASRLVQAGVPLAAVQQWMGHRCIQVTMRYAHLAPKNLTDARDVLERSLRTTSGSNPSPAASPQTAAQQSAAG